MANSDVVNTDLEALPKQPTPSAPNNPAAAGTLSNVVSDASVTAEERPQTPEKDVEDATVIFVPFEDFSGRINQEDFDFRKDVPTRVPKSQANIWLEGKKGYIK